MERRPPASPREAWEEDGSSQGSSSSQPFSFYDTTTMQPLQLDASWLPIYEESEEAVDFIVAFVSSLDKDPHKFTFLKSTYVLCKTALKRGMTQGLALFCQTCEVVENITDLLEKEPRDHLTSQIRYLAMITIDELCLVENMLEGKTKSLLSACFSSVFLLPSEREMPYQSASLYMRDQEFEGQAHILDALEPLERDGDISISSLAAHTGLVLRAPRVQRRSWVIHVCCWCR